MDWVNGHAMLKTLESTVTTAQDLLRKCWGHGVDLQRRVADWAFHIFREYNREADARSGKGVKGREEEWVDTENVVWPDVTALCGFWEGSCERGTCGAGIVIQVFTKTLGWATVQKKKSAD